MIHACFDCHLDGFNSRYSCSSQQSLRSLQLAQNATCWFLTNTKKRGGHIPLVIGYLRWHAVSFRTYFKILIISLVVHLGLAPKHIVDLLSYCDLSLWNIPLVVIRLLMLLEIPFLKHVFRVFLKIKFETIYLENKIKIWYTLTCVHACLCERNNEKSKGYNLHLNSPGAFAKTQTDRWQKPLVSFYCLTHAAGLL